MFHKLFAQKTDRKDSNLCPYVDLITLITSIRNARNDGATLMDLPSPNNQPSVTNSGHSSKMLYACPIPCQFPVPTNEQERQADLDRYLQFGRLPEEALSDITAIVSEYSTT